MAFFGHRGATSAARAAARTGTGTGTRTRTAAAGAGAPGGRPRPNNSAAPSPLVFGRPASKPSWLLLPSSRRRDGYVDASRTSRRYGSSSSSSSSYVSGGERNDTPPSAEEVDDPPPSSFVGRSVSESLRSAVRVLESGRAPEPDWSAVHLLSDALGLDWDGGYRDLLPLLEDDGEEGGDDGSPGVGEDDADPHAEAEEPAVPLARRILTASESAVLSSHLSRRLSMEPLQYVLGKWDFLDFTANVRPPCLCPRPETEELVELAAGTVRDALRRRKRKERRKKVRILDVGCGTGVIGVALARMFGPDDVEVVAIDVEETAVDLSNENAGDLLVGIDSESDEEGGNGSAEDEETKAAQERRRRKWYQALRCSAADFTNEGRCDGDEDGGLSSSPPSSSSSSSPPYEFDFDVVVSNPPYIPRADMPTLSRDVAEYESDRALCGGDDGLDVVRDIVARLPEWAAGAEPVAGAGEFGDGDEEEEGEGGGEARWCDCWMEVDPSHPGMIEEWLGKREAANDGGGGDGDGGSRVEFARGVKDMSGRDRFVHLRLVVER